MHAAPITLRSSEVQVATGAGVATPDAKLLRIQIFPISDEPLHHDDGELLFDRAFAERLVANFKAYPRAVPADYDHGTEALTGNPATGLAAGWVKAVRIEGEAVFAYVEPTARALAHVESQEYRLASPALHLDWTNPETGKKQGPTLLSVALTNRPFLPRMAPVEAIDRASVTLRAREASAPMNTEAHVADPKNLPAEGAEQPKTISLADHTAQIVAFKDQITTLSDQVKALTDRAAKAEGEVKALRDEKAKAEAEGDVEKLLAAGKALPAQKPGLLAFRLADPKSFAAFADTLTVQVNLGAPKGSTGDADKQNAGKAVSLKAAELEKSGADLRTSYREAAKAAGLTSLAGN